MPHDAHPMGMLVNAMSALSVYHPDANPALKVSNRDFGQVQVTELLICSTVIHKQCKPYLCYENMFLILSCRNLYFFKFLVFANLLAHFI